MNSFSESVWKLAGKIPKGKVTTYKEIAGALNSRAYRAVGQALKRNPYAPEIPCHRVVCSDGRLGGYMGRQKSGKKAELLKKEGIEIRNGKIDLKRFLHRF